MTIADEFTPDQIMGGLALAIRERDFPAAVSLLKMLAVRDPRSAQQIYDAIVHGTVTVQLTRHTAPCTVTEDRRIDTETYHDAT